MILSQKRIQVQERAVLQIFSADKKGPGAPPPDLAAFEPAVEIGSVIYHFFLIHFTVSHTNSGRMDSAATVIHWTPVRDTT